MSSSCSKQKQKSKQKTRKQENKKTNKKTKQNNKTFATDVNTNSLYVRRCTLNLERASWSL